MRICVWTLLCTVTSDSDYQHKAAGVYKKGRVGVRVLVRVEHFGFPLIHCTFHSSSPCFIIWTHLVSLRLSQWAHQRTFFSCSPPIKRCVPPASEMNDFISKTCAGSVPPVSYIFFYCVFYSMGRLWCCVWASVPCSVQALTLFDLVVLFCVIRLLAWAGNVCMGVCVWERENVRVGEERGPTNMPGAGEHFACKLATFLFLSCNIHPPKGVFPLFLFLHTCCYYFERNTVWTLVLLDGSGHF